MKARTQTSLAVACAIAFGIGVVAQSQVPDSRPAPAPGSQQPAQPARSAASETGPVTLTGCLVRDIGTMATAAGSSSVNRGSQGIMFKLTQIERAGMSAGAASAPSGASSPAPAPGVDTSAPRPGANAQASDMSHAGEFRLVAAAAGVDLSEHLNHRVRVTGTRSAAGSTPTAPGVSSGSASSPGSGSSSNSGSGSSSSSGSSQSRAMQSAPTEQDQHAGMTPTLMVSSITMVSSTCQ